MLYKIIAVITAMEFVISGVGATAPMWVVPEEGFAGQLDFSVINSSCLVTQVHALSGDTIEATYSVLSQNPNGGFSINDSVVPGSYTLKCDPATIMASSATLYTVVLRATNSGESADRTITITVTHPPVTNFNAPVFSGTPNQLIVCRDKIDCRDDISGPFVLFAVTVTDADNDTVTLSLPDADPEIFTTETTKIKVKGSLENLPSPYELKVIATDNGTPQKSSSVTVTLILGYAPKFTDPSNSSDVIYLCETLVGGDELIKLQALDSNKAYANLIFSMDDSPSDTQALFEIEGDRLKVKDGISSGTFDYENPNDVLKYNVSLRVSDGTFITILNTQIVLEDFNDYPPTFVDTPYSKSIPEATNAGSSVFRVTSTDADKTSPNNEVTFTLSGSNDFTINNASGVISVAAGVALNYDTTPSYSLTVTATDGGEIDNLTATALVTLNISTKPTFDNLASPKSVSVDENVAIGTPVFTLTVSDRDHNAALNLSIKSQSVSGAFVLNGSVLQTATSIDKETLSSYTISFNADDGTYNVESALLTVNVNDVNENPIITVSSSPVKLLESTPAGTQIFKASASDPDMSAPNNVITYTLTGSSDFIIDAKSGVVSVVSGITLNYTRQASYQLIVTAMDGGSPPLSSSHTVTLSLQTKPSFDDLSSAKTVTIYENVSIGTHVFTIAVSHKDNSSIVHTTIKNQSVNGAFVLSGSILQTAITIDKETLSSYTISFSATDGTYTVDSAVLTVNVKDVNEKPNISVPSSPVKLLESTPAGTQVFNVSASDPDMSAPNNVITFSLSGSGSNDFSIMNSVVSVASGVTLNYTRQPSYQLVIIALDGGTPSLSSSSTVTVNIQTKPMFDTLTSANNIFVDENVPIGTSVFTVAVSDKDQSGILNLAIKSQSVSGAFILNGRILQTATNIDREALISYTLSFIVADEIYSTESAPLIITVNDLNDNPPIISPINNITIPENKAMEEVIGTILAIDSDATKPNNVLTYSIQDGNVNGYFSLNNSSGELKLVKQPKSTDTKTYRLKVKVVDGGNPQLSATVDFSVAVDETTVDECLSKPCFNGGICSSYVNVYSCKCAAGWNGTQCQYNIDDCTPNPCKNAGKCIDGVNMFTCNCRAGWVGTSCTLRGIQLQVGMVVNATCPDLSKLPEYKNVDSKIIKMLKDVLKIEEVLIFNIWCGSIGFESKVIINDTDLAKTALAQAIQQVYSGQTTLRLGTDYITSRNVTINGNTLSPNASVCEVFTLISHCGSDHQCSYENSTASCKSVNLLNRDLLIGLCIGLILPLTAVLIMIIVAVYCRIRRRRYKSKKSSSLNDFLEPRPDKLRGPRWQGHIHRSAMVGYTNQSFTNGAYTRSGPKQWDCKGISAKANYACINGVNTRAGPKQRASKGISGRANYACTIGVNTRAGPNKRNYNGISSKANHVCTNGVNSTEGPNKRNYNGILGKANNACTNAAYTNRAYIKAGSNKRDCNRISTNANAEYTNGVFTKGGPNKRDNFGIVY